MEKIKIKVKDLLEKINANREQHAKDYRESDAGFKEQAIKALESALEDAKCNKCVRLTFNDLIRPVSYLKDYDKAIMMLEMCTEKEIEVSSIEFSQYVMDEWNWKQSFLLSNMKYK